MALYFFNLFYINIFFSKNNLYFFNYNNQTISIDNNFKYSFNTNTNLSTNISEFFKTNNHTSLFFSQNNSKIDFLSFMHDSHILSLHLKYSSIIITPTANLFNNLSLLTTNMKVFSPLLKNYLMENSNKNFGLLTTYFFLSINNDVNINTTNFLSKVSTNDNFYESIFTSKSYFLDNNDKSIDSYFSLYPSHSLFLPFSRYNLKNISLNLYMTKNLIMNTNSARQIRWLMKYSWFSNNIFTHLRTSTHIKKLYGDALNNSNLSNIHL